MESGRRFDVAIEPQLTTNDLRPMLRLKLAGAGITFAPSLFFKQARQSDLFWNAAIASHINIGLEYIGKCPQSGISTSSTPFSWMCCR